MAANNDQERLKSEPDVPIINTGLLPRPHLTRRIHEATAGKLTVISAPAGFGKTSLVCQWIEHHNIDTVAWHTVDESDNYPDVFLRNLLSALHGARKPLKDAFDPLLQSPKIPAEKDILITIINAINQLSEKIYLVLDDFHLIQNEQNHYAVQYILKYTRAQLHMTLLTRHQTSIPLSRFRASHQLSEVFSTDLRFTLKETDDFFAKIIKISLRPDQIDQIQKQTEGWIAGIQLLSISLKDVRQTDLDNRLADLTSQAPEKLMEKMFENLAADIREFLLKTSVLEKLHIGLCGAVTGFENVAELMGKIERLHFFLIPIDIEGKWYKYHQLFSEFLRSRLNRVGPADIAGVHRNASAWYAENGYLADAFHHGFATNDLDYAADLLEDNIFTMIVNYEFDTAFRWMDRLPKEVLHHRFMLILFKAWAAFSKNDFDHMEKLVTTLEGHSGMADSPHARDLLLALKMGVLFHKEPYEKCVTEVKKAVESLSIDSVFPRGFVRSILARAHLQAGDIRLAMEPLELDFENLIVSGCDYLALYILALKADVQRLQGRLHSSEKTILDAIDFACGKGIRIGRALADFNIRLAKIYYNQNRLEKAQAHIDKCIRSAKPMRAIGCLFQAYQLQSLIHEINGDARSARDFMETALTLARSSKSPEHHAFSEIVSVQLAIKHSDFRMAKKWAKNRNLKSDDPFSKLFEIECLTLGRLHLAQGEYHHAEQLMVALREQAVRRGRSLTALCSDVIRASALYATGARDDALSTMEKAVESATAEELVRPFIDNADHVTAMFIHLTKSRKPTVRLFAQKLLKTCWTSCATPISEDTIQCDAFEHLTRREAEILKLITAGFTNKKIADIMSIKLGTVKSHIKHIYGKLDVTNREKAISRSKDLPL